MPAGQIKVQFLYLCFKVRYISPLDAGWTDISYVTLVFMAFNLTIISNARCRIDGRFLK